MIKAIIYDIDGTLINSEPLHVASWDEALKIYGSSLSMLSEKFRASMAGRKPIDIAYDMSNELQLPINGSQLLSTKAEMLLRAVSAGVTEMPGAVASVKRFHNVRMQLGIGAALDLNYVTLVLNKFDIKELFTVIVSGDQIIKGKPDPETYETVVNKLGLQPDECVVFEDAKSGIASAKAAGCNCIAITNDEANKQDTSKADKIVSSWDEVTLDVLERF